MHGRSRMTRDPRIPTMLGRSTSGFHQPGRHCLHQARSAVRCSASRMKGDLLWLEGGGHPHVHYRIFTTPIPTSDSVLPHQQKVRSAILFERRVAYHSIADSHRTILKHHESVRPDRNRRTHSRERPRATAKKSPKMLLRYVQ